MTRILISGASGFIGAHLAQVAVSQGYDVTCLVRTPSSLERLKGLPVRRICGDIMNPASFADAIQRQDVVFHLAACLRALESRRFDEINAQGTKNVAEACAAKDTPPVLVVVSSLAAVGPSNLGRPRQEDDPPSPVSDYGRSKLHGEEAAREFADRVPITIVRPPMVFGEADPATGQVYRMIARWGIHLVPTLRQHRLSLIHADDLANLLLLAGKRGKRLSRDVPQPAPGEGCYFAACERDVTFAEWGLLVGEALGRKRTFVLRTGPAIRWAVAGVASAISWLWGRPWYFNMDKAREAGAGSWTCVPNAANRDLGFRVGAPLVVRIQQTIRWYRDYGWL
jgi:dihydroflavonol-4-reductase